MKGFNPQFQLMNFDGWFDLVGLLYLPPAIPAWNQFQQLILNSNFSWIAEFNFSFEFWLICGMISIAGWRLAKTKIPAFIQATNRAFRNLIEPEINPFQFMKWLINGNQSKLHLSF